MKRLSLITANLALLSPSAFAQTVIPQSQVNMPDIITTIIIFLIALGTYHLTKTKIQQKKPNFPVVIHHAAGAIMAAMIFYVIFFFIGFCF
ncbi:hypothetical protein C0Z01_07330 [Photobacterium kishitanii]|uniref:Uncharacterized protein n=1 Tax=Photobacterium kishitanii TaxID=318456 RepID=A0A2T3KI98_9GAMM|nr:hypothetical protein [Photobacterium kishitanii]OBU20608.1 hypothetical protein AYY22_09825 [Photobacterium kishitanii]PSU89394.1 hypothetical protein C0W42_09735 [Photobacterium kishitanii]PSU93648.1 hypothetical protein C0W35_10580 [Photobacterium kishitanii]PSU98900.1 hypothetical protein C9J27_10380 [Photobacterium kishitanii]PSV18662.1 hypothetical protein C0W28_12055 [Photobacterium kishitanii]